MTVRVRVFANPQLERSVVNTFVHDEADRFAITPTGDLEILEGFGLMTTKRKAYSAGHWIDAEVVKP